MAATATPAASALRAHHDRPVGCGGWGVCGGGIPIDCAAPGADGIPIDCAAPGDHGDNGDPGGTAPPLFTGYVTSPPAVATTLVVLSPTLRRWADTTNPFPHLTCRSRCGHGMAFKTVGASSADACCR